METIAPERELHHGEKKEVALIVGQVFLGAQFVGDKILRLNFSNGHELYIWQDEETNKLEFES